MPHLALSTSQPRIVALREIDTQSLVGGTISKYMSPGEMMGGDTHGIGWGPRTSILVLVLLPYFHPADPGTKRENYIC